MTEKSALILGGTAEASALASLLHRTCRCRVVTSLAGRTATPRLPEGETRIGGFGGAAGLADYLRSSGISAVVDATHPFASRMGWNAAEACAAARVPLLRLDRPAWTPGPGDHWHEVADWEEAVGQLDRTARRVFLAVGRQELAAFSGLDHLWFLLRFAEAAPPQPPPAHFHLLADRGPFTLEGEIALLRDHRIDAIVCRNSGGLAAKAKLEAAAALGLPVIMRRRPPRPAGAHAGTPEQAAAWVDSVLSA